MRTILSFVVCLAIIFTTFLFCSLAFGMTSEPVAGLPGADDPVGWWKWSLDHVQNGALKFAAGGLVMLAVWGVRAAVATYTDPSGWIARLAANRWGALAIATVTSVGAGLGHTLAAGGSPGWPLVRTAIEVLGVAVLGWALAKSKLTTVAPVKPVVAG